MILKCYNEIMKKAFLTFLILIVNSFLYFGCSLAPKFELDAKVYYREVKPGERFVVVVTATNVGGTYRYRGSSTVIGAEPELYCETENGLFRLYIEEQNVTADVTNITIRRGEIITGVWYFEARGKDDIAPVLGEYSLKLTYLDNVLIKENFLKITDQID